MGAYTLYSEALDDFAVCQNTGVNPVKNPSDSQYSAWCVEFLETVGPDGEGTTAIQPGDMALSSGAVSKGDSAYFGIYTSSSIYTSTLAPLPGFEKVSLSLEGIPPCTGDSCFEFYKVGIHQFLRCCAFSMHYIAGLMPPFP